ncbi:chondroitin lyase [Fulvivirga sp. M361]|uniref:polysaccharide lyase family 8 super-sandwich domain-containing protein n=1 Tax=Fulvivirga sp. M361 TaxID=2594266 RepID=UPI00117BA855|nr:polysaccharide lyase family 8 super-sandwich domain-containing protein [Fulvivirga sp. M361]TRX61688.1 chondroitin lyase [Fulvivirga sp. M361]
MIVRLLSLIFCVAISVEVFGQNDLQKIKKHIVKELLKADMNDQHTKKAMVTMKEDGSWPDINYKDVSLTGFEHSYHVENLMAMALSYCKKGSEFYKDKKLKNSINKSLKFWCENDFISDNWWHNIIFLPKTLVTISLFMEKDINKDVLKKVKAIISRANQDNPWARPSADKIRIADIEAKYYVLIGDEEKFERIITLIESEVKFSTGNRGLQSDYSFHHRVHRENNTIPYGVPYGDACIKWAAHVANTKYVFSEEKIKLMVDYYLDGICKQMVYGKHDEKGVANRDITRKETTLIFSPVTMETLLEVTDYRKPEILEIINLRKGSVEKPTLSFCKFFWQSELLTFQRPNFFTSVRMFSIRNRNMELAHNGEGIFNHHRGDGTNHLAVKGNEYLNIWPVYDWQKIPGTTVLQKPGLPSQHEIQKDGLTSFVGAVTDGLYGAAGFDFISPHDHIRVKKSWFFFDEEYVCLGAGIASNNFRYPVATTINQTLLNGDVLVSKANGKSKIDIGDHKLDNVSWVFHDGTGYIFPCSTHINITNKTESGRWSDINLQVTSPKELVEKDVFKLWVDHGKRPQGENLWLYPGKMDTKDVTYQYIVVPVTTPDALNTDRNIEILSNTSKLQAVKHKGLGIIQIVFYTSGKVEIGKDLWVTLDSPGIIMLKTKGDAIESISASDPSRTLNKLHIGISGKNNLVVDLPDGDYAGSSVTINEFD